MFADDDDDIDDAFLKRWNEMKLFIYMKQRSCFTMLNFSGIFVYLILVVASSVALVRKCVGILITLWITQSVLPPSIVWPTVGLELFRNEVVCSTTHGTFLSEFLPTIGSGTIYME